MSFINDTSCDTCAVIVTVTCLLRHFYCDKFDETCQGTCDDNFVWLFIIKTIGLHAWFWGQLDNTPTLIWPSIHPPTDTHSWLGAGVGERSAPALVWLGQDLADVAEDVTLVQEHVVRRLELEAPATHGHLLETTNTATGTFTRKHIPFISHSASYACRILQASLRSHGLSSQ